MQREEPRLALPLPIIIEWKTQDGISTRVRAWSKNVSYQGLCLVLEPVASLAFSSLGIGSSIQLSANRYHQSATGVVCRLTRQSDGRLAVGIKLDSPLFGWLARYSLCSRNLLANFVPTT